MAALTGSVTFSGATPSGAYGPSDDFVVANAGVTCALAAPTASAIAGTGTVSVAAVDQTGACSAVDTVSDADGATWSAVTGAYGYAIWRDGALAAVVGTTETSWTEDDYAERQEACIKYTHLPASPPASATRGFWRFDGGAPPAGDGSYTGYRDDAATLEAGGDLDWKGEYRVWRFYADTTPVDVSAVQRWNQATVHIAYPGVFTKATLIDNALLRFALDFGDDQVVERLHLDAEFWSCMWGIGDGYSAEFICQNTTALGQVWRDCVFSNLRTFALIYGAVDSASGYSDAPVKTIFDNCRWENYGGCGHDSLIFLKGSARFTNCRIICKRTWGSHGLYLQINDWDVVVHGCTFDNIRGAGVHIYGSSAVSGRADVTISSCNFRNILSKPILAQVNSSGSRVKGVTVTACHFRDCESASYFNKIRSVVIQGCTWEDCYAAFKVELCQGVSIQGNVLTNTASPAANTVSAHVVDCTNIVMTGNICQWDAASDAYTSQIAFHVDTSSKGICSGNVSDQHKRAYGAIYAQGCTDLAVNNNLAFSDNNAQAFLYGYTGVPNTRGSFVGNVERHTGSAKSALFLCDGAVIGNNVLPTGTQTVGGDTNTTTLPTSADIQAAVASVTTEPFRAAIAAARPVTTGPISCAPGAPGSGYQDPATIGDLQSLMDRLSAAL